MANNKIQIKRTSVTGRTANVTSSGNSQFIDAGEFALNMAYGILYTSNWSSLITVGSNLVNQNITGNLTVNAVIANGSFGTAGQVLSTNSTGVYWSSAGSGSVTSVNTGNGMTGGPITSTGTVSVLANTGIVANSTGVFVNTSYIGTLTANNSNNLGGVLAASYVQNTDSRTLSGNLTFSGANVRFTGNVGIANTAPAQTLTVDGTIGGTIIATQAEAEAGSSTTKLMTPERVLQSLAKNALDGIVVRTFTTTGQSPYVPTTGMKYCLVFATGGGGGGGGSDAADTTAASAGGGGGAGGTAIKYYTAAQIGASAEFAVGGGGTAGSATNGTDGGTGGTTTFTPSGGGAALSASAGTLGNGSGLPTTGVNAAGGLGGTPTGGDFNVTGGDGNGGAGHTDGTIAIAGSGGNSFWGGGGRGASDVSGSAAGQAGGTNTGGGGGGAATVNTTTGAAGGSGGAGVIFILEFI